MYIKLFLSLIFFVLFPVAAITADDVRLLQKQEIHKKAVVIEKKMLRDKYVLIGLTTLGHVYNIYVFLSFVAPFFANDGSTLPANRSCEACKELANVPLEKISFLTSLRSGLASVGYNTKNLFTTQQGWRSIGQFSMYYAGLLSGSFIASRVADNLIHPDTLRWYIAAYVPYEPTIQLIKDTICIMQHESLVQEEIDYNRRIIKDSLNRLARYGESICAYMVYKSHFLQEEEQIVAESAMGHFFNSYNGWLVDAFGECASENPDYNHLNELVVIYEKEVAAQLRHFYAIEGETKIDRRTIVEML